MTPVYPIDPTWASVSTNVLYRKALPLINIQHIISQHKSKKLLTALHECLSKDKLEQPVPQSTNSGFGRSMFMDVNEDFMTALATEGADMTQHYFMASSKRISKQFMKISNSNNSSNIREQYLKLFEEEDRMCEVCLNPYKTCKGTVCGYCLQQRRLPVNRTVLAHEQFRHTTHFDLDRQAAVFTGLVCRVCEDATRVLEVISWKAFGYKSDTMPDFVIRFLQEQQSNRLQLINMEVPSQQHNSMDLDILQLANIEGPSQQHNGLQFANIEVPSQQHNGLQFMPMLFDDEGYHQQEPATQFYTLWSTEGPDCILVSGTKNYCMLLFQPYFQ
jgi:hypothetical protein